MKRLLELFGYQKVTHFDELMIVRDGQGKRIEIESSLTIRPPAAKQMQSKEV